MIDASDDQLLSQFARDNSEAAFSALVQRHLTLVHSVALRHTTNPQHAQDISQAVFIILARKAGTISRKTILAGWLYHTARLTAANFQRSEERRIRREQEVFMETTVEEATPDMVWQELSPQLDSAMASLGAADRDALVLRYFQNKPLSEVSDALGIEEKAAQKRVSRALEKLRKFFGKRGMMLPVAAVAGALSANSVMAAPAGMGKIISKAAVAKGAAGGASTLALVKGTLKLMAWTNAKIAVVASVGLLLAAGTTTVVVKAVRGPAFDDSLWDESYHPDYGYNLDKAPPGIVVIRPTHFAGGNQGGLGSMTGKIGGRNTVFLNVVGAAYGVTMYRIVLDTPLPQGRFDYAVSTTNEPEKKLQAEIKEQFGLTAHFEMQATDVLLLKTNEQTLSILQPGNSGDGSVVFAPSRICMTNCPIDELRSYLEGGFREPVLDKTGLTNVYDFCLDWPKPFGYPDKKGQEFLRRNLAGELGIDTVSSRETIRMLVVDRVKD